MKTQSSFHLPQKIAVITRPIKERVHNFSSMPTTYRRANTLEVSECIYPAQRGCENTYLVLRFHQSWRLKYKWTISSGCALSDQRLRLPAQATGLCACVRAYLLLTYIPISSHPHANHEVYRQKMQVGK